MYDLSIYYDKKQQDRGASPKHKLLRRDITEYLAKPRNARMPGGVQIRPGTLEEPR